MDYQQHNYQLFFLFVAVILTLAGCAPRMQKPLQICPGAESADELLYLLQVYAHDAEPVKAHGQCLAQFYTEGKRHKENFPVKLWFNPPTHIRLHGNVAFNARGIDLGSNESEFWLAMKPKEIGNSYFWGRWDDWVSFWGLKISPRILLEAAGIIGVDDRENWSLSNEGTFDVLTERDEAGSIIKKIHTYNCDRRVRKIEYFGDNEQIAVILELNEYRDIYNGASVPRVIKVIGFNSDGTEDSFRITLDSIRRQDFSAKLHKALFTRPEPKGFKHVGRIIAGEVVEQQQK